MYYGGCFTPLSHDHLTDVLQCLLQQASYQQCLYSSHSFRIGTATTAAAAGFPAWLIKSLGRWSSDAYQMYIQCPPETLRLIPSLLARADTFKQSPWTRIPTEHQFTKVPYCYAVCYVCIAVAYQTPCEC